MAVDVYAVFLAHVIEVINALAVFVKVCGIDAYNGVQALSSAVNETGNRQLELAYYLVLMGDVGRIGFDQSISELRHIFIFDAFAVQRIEAYPRPRLRLAVAYYATYVALAFAQSLYKLSRSPGIHAFRRQVFTVFFPAFGDITDRLPRLKERFEIFGNLLYGIPFVGNIQLLAFNPAFVDKNKIILLFSDNAVPVKRAVICLKMPAVIFCHLNDSPRRNRCSGAVEGIPLFFAVAGMIALVRA